MATNEPTPLTISTSSGTWVSSSILTTSATTTTSWTTIVSDSNSGPRVPVEPEVTAEELEKAIEEAKRRQNMSKEEIDALNAEFELKRSKAKKESQDNFTPEKFKNYKFDPSKFVTESIPLEFVKRIASICESVYPGNWDLRNSVKGSFAIMVRFPCITVTNASGMKQVVKELIVSFDLYVKDKKVYTMRELQGRRFHFTTREFQSEYHHSHLPNSFGGWVNFCLGSDVVGQLLSTMSAGTSLKDEKWFIKLEALLYQIGEYVLYENTGGRPFRYIKDIGNSSNSQDLTDEEMKLQLKRLFRPVSIKKLQEVMQLTIDYSIGKCSIVNTAEYEAVLSAIATKHQYRNQYGIFYFDDGKKKTYSLSGVIPSAQPVTFRGVTFKPFIKEEETQELQQDDNRTKYCNREIKREFEKRILSQVRELLLYRSDKAISMQTERRRTDKRESDSKLRVLAKKLKVVQLD